MQMEACEQNIQEPLKLGLFTCCILGVDKLISFDKSQTAYQYFDSLCHKHLIHAQIVLATGFQ